MLDLFNLVRVEETLGRSDPFSLYKEPVSHFMRDPGEQLPRLSARGRRGNVYGGQRNVPPFPPKVTSIEILSLHLILLSLQGSGHFQRFLF